jgi:dihydropteroate synthase
MGVLNSTPDSFSDGGRYLRPADARQRVSQLLAEGADLLDLGAESSRPGSEEVPAEVQIARLTPALEAATEQGAFVSIDTTNPVVAGHCLARGARMINDVSCLRQPELAKAAAAHNAWLVLSHSRAPMAQMAGFSQWPDDAYADIVHEVMEDWGTALDRAEREGLSKDRLVFDPGFGFSKNAHHSFELLTRLEEFRALGVPILTGPGRKSFIAAVDGSPPEKRLGGTIAACIASARAGADLVRVHDVAEVKQALLVWYRTLALETGGS